MNKMRASSLLTTVWTLFCSWDSSANAEEQPHSLHHRDLMEGDDYNDDFGFHLEPRIVGGTMADEDEFDYYVNLRGCGGALVAQDVILTAAHCRSLNPRRGWIGGNTYNQGERARIKQGSATPHPRYRRRTQNNDLMLYKLTKPVSSNVVPIALNADENNPSGDDLLTVMGFGTTSEDGEGSFYLSKVDVNHISYDTCNEAYWGDVINGTMFCAGVEGGGKDSCQGDSGGPIIDQNGVLVGITSWGYGCGRAGYPGVYARVSNSIDWLHQKICQLSDSPPSFCDGIEISSESETNSNNNNNINENNDSDNNENNEENNNDNDNNNGGSNGGGFSFSDWWSGAFGSN